MAVVSPLQRQKRTFQQDPIRTTLLCLVVLSWGACFVWMVVAKPAGMASTLFGVSAPSFWQTMAARALAVYPVVLLAVWSLFRLPFRLTEMKRNPPEPTEFDRRLHRGMGSPQLDDPDHTMNINPSDPKLD